ncbi:MAG: methylmalonyl Co-A mutase-associated GTPase MeaB [Myxococcales bacterium]|nr:methylmalonyl Co-A mutase-associated GTPase MeaB [Myxococcales bacterium]
MARRALRYEPDEWADRVRNGGVRAAARLMRMLDDHDPLAFEVMKRVYRSTGRARVLGVTGNPGAGKSTLVTRLIGQFRQARETVGIVAVDPSSPYSGGAILGDRIRMQQFATDPGVFIRSQATRGKLGGLASSTNDVVNVLDAMGYDVVIVETVGVGQDEIDIMKLADTVLVVMVPGYGDDIQTIKAGLLEIADLFVVNKADRHGIDTTLRDLRQLQTLREAHDERWTPPILKTVAVRGDGIPELMQSLQRHRDFLVESGEHDRRRQRRAVLGLVELLSDRIKVRLEQWLSKGGQLEALGAAIAGRERDPYSETEAILGSLLREP